MKWLGVILLVRTVLSVPYTTLNDRSMQDPGILENMEQAVALNDQSMQDPGILENIEQAVGPPCPEGWTEFENFCYFASDSDKTWDEAQTYCKGLGGDLVKINSAEENEFVLAFVRENSPSVKAVWIGLKWNSQVKDYLWSDNSVPVYKNWAPHEPSGKAGEPCGNMWTGHSTALPIRASGYWNDRTCSVVRGWPCSIVCKRLP